MLRVFMSLLLLVGVAKASDTLPDFRGIRLSSAMTQAQIMHALGADKFKVDPDTNIWTPDKMGDIEKHGMMYVLEKVEFDIGPFCENDGPKKFYCRNPYMVVVFGADHNHGICTEVFVENGVGHTIDVMFDSLQDEEFFEAMYDKYGKSGWKEERDPDMVITDLSNKTHQQVERVTLTKKMHDYTITATNYDIVFTHPLPLYQGLMEMRLVDRNF